MEHIFKTLIRVKDQDEIPNPLADPDAIYLIGESGKEWLAKFLCPCGCGKRVFLSLNNAGGSPKWGFSINDDKISFTPSINSTGFECKSHYYITNNVAK